VLPETASQVDVYTAAVEPIVEDVLNGYNGTIMAYGQTGAGRQAFPPAHAPAVINLSFTRAPDTHDAYLSRREGGWNRLSPYSTYSADAQDDGNALILGSLLARRAGKTYTLSSCQKDNIGMMPRAAAAVFAHIAGDPSHHYSVCMSYIQIYRELLQARACAA
jgi:hypothetical protein